MAEYKLIASDLDGTLLRDDQTLSPENEAAIRALAERGVRFAISSGRTYGEILPSLREHPLIPYVIYSDGAVIYDRQTGARHTTCFSGDVKRLVLDALFSCETYLSVHHRGVSYYDGSRTSPEDYRRSRVPEYFRKIFDLGQPVYEHFPAFCHELDEIEQITVFFGHDEDLIRCKKLFLDTGLLGISVSSETNFEVYHRDAGKGNALLKLAQILGISREQAIAIGDTSNDRSMVEAAGLGLATANAMDSLKHVADAVICSNEEHVARYVLEHYI